jgi:hypothetical protein
MTYKKRIAMSKERMEEAMRANARRFGHHGPKVLAETIRQREGIAIDLDHAAQLCRTYAGWEG